MTYLMKFKSIDIGYTFFTLNDVTTGWCCNVIPQGLVDENRDGE